MLLLLTVTPDHALLIYRVITNSTERAAVMKDV